jgi:cellulose synthase/poly-beta-1,6-N-acetylglucosamine synthase-like glycosyltransferase
MLASAPSLAYRKSLYQKVQGFKGLEHLISGDDDMLVHKMTRCEGGNVRYNLDREACVATSPVQTWTEVLQQRARWASNGTKYQNKRFVGLLSCIFGFYLWIFLSPFTVLAGVLPLYAFIVPLCLKMCLDTLFLTHTAPKLRQKRLLIHIWWVALIHVPITITAVIMGQFRLYRWR